MRQFLVSAGRTVFNTKGLYAIRRAGMEPTRRVTTTSTKDHPTEEPQMSNWEHTKEKISNKGKAGFGSDTQPVEMPIVERARVKGADRQATQHQKMEGMGSMKGKGSLQSDMNAGIGINQSDATASQKWTEKAKDQTHDFGDFSKSKNQSQEQLARDAASGKFKQDGGMSKEMRDLAEKQKRADERAAKYPNMPKQEFKQGRLQEKEHKQTDKITDVINEEHGIPEVGQKNPKNLNPQKTGKHEEHGANFNAGADDMLQFHQPKMRFDPARSSAENANKFTEEHLERRDIRNTADHQRMEKGEHGMVDSMKEKANAATGWIKDMLGSDPAQQRMDAKQAKAEGKQRVSEAKGKVQPQMRGEFGIPSGSPVGGISQPEKRPRIKTPEEANQ